MINLSPQENKKILLSRYRERRLVVAGALLAGLLVVSGVLVASTYFVVGYRRSATEKIFAAESVQTQTRELIEQTEAAMTLKTKLEMFKQAEQMTGGLLVPDLARKIESLRSSGISINNIDFSGESQSSWRIGLHGVSTSRKNLTNYLDKLRADPQFSLVESPISNLLSDVGGRFTINLTVATEQKR